MVKLNVFSTYIRHQVSISTEKIIVKVIIFNNPKRDTVIKNNIVYLIVTGCFEKD